MIPFTEEVDGGQQVDSQGALLNNRVERFRPYVFSLTKVIKLE